MKKQPTIHTWNVYPRTVPENLLRDAYRQATGGDDSTLARDEIVQYMEQWLEENKKYLVDVEHTSIEIHDVEPWLLEAEQESSRPARRSGPPGNHTIEILTSGNPKRAGTKSAARFDLYKMGMTVDEYLRACLNLQGGSDPSAYVKDLSWDQEREWIRLHPPV